MNLCIPFLLSLLLLTASPQVKAATDKPIIVEARPKPGEKPADAAMARAMARLMTAHFGFLHAVHRLSPSPAWLEKNAKIEFYVLPAIPELFRNPDLALLRPTSKERGELYVANVFARGDAKQKPLYLYLLAMHDNQTEIVRGYRIKRGKP